MELLGRITIPRRRGTEPPASIELLTGDLASIPPEHAVDVLVVSAFPNSYTPSRGTVFEAFHLNGLRMMDVAREKEEDERDRLGCWISRPLPPEIARRFHFDRIVCFEPRYPAFRENTGVDIERLEDTVGYVFRGLNNFILPDTTGEREGRSLKITRVAMPVLASGNQGVPAGKLLPRLLEAAAFWLEEGLPIQCLKVIAFGPEQTLLARRIFSEWVERRGAERAWAADLANVVATQVIQVCAGRLRQELLSMATDQERSTVEAVLARVDANRVADAAAEYDLFISYAHKQASEVEEFVRELNRQRPELRIFYDRDSIQAGALWIQAISDAVQKARKFVALLSPDYSASPVCWDEFQCAKLKEYNTRESVIHTVRLYSDPALPPIMGIHSWTDCAEGDLVKLRACAATLA